MGAEGLASGALSSGVTVNGLVTFEGLVPIDGAALLSCAGGTYVDEASGLRLPRRLPAQLLRYRAMLYSQCRH